MDAKAAVIVSIEDKSQSQLSSISVTVDDSKNKSDNTPYFTNRHDHGTLPEMKTVGYYNNLIKSLQECKGFCDVTITNMMINEKPLTGIEEDDEIDEENLDREEKKQKCK
jgi:hypothetical protein